MSIVNASYFNGEINIPNTDKTTVLDLVNQFIDKYEPEILRKVLGYEFYKAFMLGLQQDPIEQRWQDLLLGKGYTGLDGRPYRWRGIVEGFAEAIDALELLGSIVIKVGRGNTYDPITGSNSVTIPVSIQGKPFKFFQRGFGELDPADEYTVSVDGTTLTLTSWSFSVNDKYFYHAASVEAGDNTSTPKYSFIANYVYYWYMRNNSTTTTDGGEKFSEAENASRSNPSLKISRAWNEAVEWIAQMHCYLNANRATYTEWNAGYADCLIKINPFSI